MIKIAFLRWLEAEIFNFYQNKTVNEQSRFSKIIHIQWYMSVYMLWYIYTPYSDRKSSPVMDSRVASYRPAFWKWKNIVQALKFGPHRTQVRRIELRNRGRRPRPWSQVIVMVTSMLVTDVGDQMCWWQFWDVGDRFGMLVIDLIHRKNHQHNEKRRQHNDSQISHHHKVTNITMSPISLSPIVIIVG